MKILYLIESEDPGGAENILIYLVEHFKKKAKVVVGCLKKGWIYYQLKNRHIDTFLIPHRSGSYDIGLIIRIAKLIKSQKANLVHSHLFDINFYSSISAKLVGIPHISTEHGDIHHTSRKIDYKTRIKAKILSLLSDSIIFVSNFTKDQFIKIYKINSKKLSIIYNGINLPKINICIKNEKKRRELGIEKDCYVVGNIGSLYPVKDHKNLLNAAKLVIKTITNIKFIIIGDGPLKDELQKLSKKLGIETKVLFLGFRYDIPELFRIMDLFVISSISEAMPLVLLEAMANYVPVVTTSVGGIPEVLENGIDGLLVPPSNPEKLACAIIKMLKNKQKSLEFSKAAYEKIRSKFSIKEMLSQYEKIYRKLLFR